MSILLISRLSMPDFKPCFGCVSVAKPYKGKATILLKSTNTIDVDRIDLFGVQATFVFQDKSYTVFAKDITLIEGNYATVQLFDDAPEKYVETIDDIYIALEAGNIARIDKHRKIIGYDLPNKVWFVVDTKPRNIRDIERWISKELS